MSAALSQRPLPKPRRRPPRWTCPCCGLITLMTDGQGDKCPVCHWADDAFQMTHHDQMFGLNFLSLRQAQRNDLGADSPRTRLVSDRFKADRRWRPLTDSDPQIAAGASAVVSDVIRKQPRYWLR